MRHPAFKPERRGGRRKDESIVKMGRGRTSKIEKKQKKSGNKKK